MEFRRKKVTLRAEQGNSALSNRKRYAEKDDKVFDLYGLTEEERNVVMGS